MRRFGRRVRREAPTKSFDINTTLHYSCRYCHHWGNASTVRLHISRDGRHQNIVHCRNCGREYMSVGGLQPRLSYMSQLTTPEEPDRPRVYLTPENGVRDDVSHSSSFFSRVVSTFRSASITGNISPAGRSHSPMTQDHSALGSHAEGEEDQDYDTRMSGAGGSVSPHIQFASSSATGPPSSLSEHPEVRTIDETSASASTRRHRSFRETLAMLRTMRHEVLGRVTRRGDHLWSKIKGTRNKLKKREITAATNGVPEAPWELRDNEIQDVVPVTRSVDMSTGNSSSRLPDDIPNECKLCRDCQVYWKEIRTQMTEERKHQAAEDCPRDCCRLIRDHELPDSGTAYPQQNGEDPWLLNVRREHNIPNDATVDFHEQQPSPPLLSSDEILHQVGGWDNQDDLPGNVTTPLHEGEEVALPIDAPGEHDTPTEVTVLPLEERPFPPHHLNSDELVQRAGGWHDQVERRDSELTFGSDSQGTTHVDATDEDVPPLVLGETRYDGHQVNGNE